MSLRANSGKSFAHHTHIYSHKSIWVAFHQFLFACSVCVNRQETKPLLSSINAKEGWDGLLEMLFFHFGITPVTK